MATLGEGIGGLFGQFSFVFIFILVWVVVYGILSYTNPLKDEKRGIYGIISFVIGIIVAMSSSAVHFIRTMTTWFFVLALFFFLIIFVFGLFGLKESNWINIIKDANVHSWVIILAIVVLLFALGSTFGQRLLEKGTGNADTTIQELETIETVEQTSFADNVLKTFVNPKILGMLLVFMIALFTVIFLTKPP